MKRGDTVIVAAGGGFGGKPRPALVIQSDVLEGWRTVALLMFASDDHRSPHTRPRLQPDATNGLRQACDLMADIPITVRREKIAKVIGTLSRDDLAAAERALLVVLGFGRP